MRSANRSRGKPPPMRSGAACSGKNSNSPPSSPDAINRPLTRIRHGDSRHRNRNAQYLVGPSSKDFQALRENPPYGMLGGIVETSASFEARSAPRSYPTKAESLHLGHRVSAFVQGEA